MAPKATAAIIKNVNDQHYGLFKSKLSKYKLSSKQNLTIALTFLTSYKGHV